MGKSKQQLLERAIEKQDVKELKAALSKGADPNASLDNGHIPLVGAVLTGNEQIVTALIEGGANPKRKNALGETALQYAPNVKIAALLVAAGANINAVDDYGGTPLSMAASNGHPELIKWLHARGAKDGSCEPDGTTSLHGACLEADLKTVAVLLECGADPNARTKDGLTPLLYVEGMKRKAGVEIIKLLLKAGADPNAQMVDGRFPLYEAATEGSAAAVEALQDRFARRLGRDRSRRRRLRRQRRHSRRSSQGRGQSKCSHFSRARGPRPQREICPRIGRRQPLRCHPETL